MSTIETETSASSASGTLVDDTSISNATVDSENYSYYIYCTTQGNSDLMSVGGFRITYTKDSAD
ncbi:MAG: hypothetical protein ABII72_04005, partial [Parcubacteria group bacterium]